MQAKSKRVVNLCAVLDSAIKRRCSGESHVEHLSGEGSLLIEIGLADQAPFAGLVYHFLIKY